jgi:hypothetical protein
MDLPQRQLSVGGRFAELVARIENAKWQNVKIKFMSDDATTLCHISAETGVSPPISVNSFADTASDAFNACADLVFEQMTELDGLGPVAAPAVTDQPDSMEGTHFSDTQGPGKVVIAVDNMAKNRLNEMQQAGDGIASIDWPTPTATGQSHLQYFKQTCVCLYLRRSDGRTFRITGHGSARRKVDAEKLAATSVYQQICRLSPAA